MLTDNNPLILQERLNSSRNSPSGVLSRIFSRKLEPVGARDFPTSSATSAPSRWRGPTPSVPQLVEVGELRVRVP
ncbi:hypothetical protein AVEN_86692-1, partial [Araneus ventricosus]